MIACGLHHRNLLKPPLSADISPLAKGEKPVGRGGSKKKELLHSIALSFSVYPLPLDLVCRGVLLRPRAACGAFSDAAYSVIRMLLLHTIGVGIYKAAPTAVLFGGPVRPAIRVAERNGKRVGGIERDVGGGAVYLQNRMDHVAHLLF